MKHIFDFIIVTNIGIAFGYHVFLHQEVEAIYFLVFSLIFVELKGQMKDV